MMSGSAADELLVTVGHVHGPSCAVRDGRYWCPDCGHTRGAYRDEFQACCPWCPSSAAPVVVRRRSAGWLAGWLVRLAR